MTLNKCDFSSRDRNKYLVFLDRAKVTDQRNRFVSYWAYYSCSQAYVLRVLTETKPFMASLNDSEDHQKVLLPVRLLRTLPSIDFSVRLRWLHPGEENLYSSATSQFCLHAPLRNPTLQKFPSILQKALTASILYARHDVHCHNLLPMCQGQHCMPCLVIVKENVLSLVCTFNLILPSSSHTRE